MASNYLWLLDNGHGGIINDVYQTAGKRSPLLEDGRQLFEGEFNRAVVKRMVKLCGQEGIDFVNLVDTEMDVRLSERTDLANDIFRNTYQTSGQKCIYVSIHADAFTPDNKLEFNSARGWSVYTSPGETKSDDIATVFYEVMKKIFPDQKFRTDLSDGDVDKEAKFWVLRKTVMPAILTENFFMTNLENCQILLSEDGRDQIALAHFYAMKKIEEQLIF
jgi:N-acetylmuramoyl-L-alanine amidase